MAKVQGYLICIILYMHPKYQIKIQVTQITEKITFKEKKDIIVECYW